LVSFPGPLAAANFAGVIEARPLVAVVDDEESVGRALARLVRSAGLDAVVFSSGEDFLAALATMNPDCVVLDLHMPGLSGFEVQARILRSRFRPPVIAVTGHDSPEARTRVLSAGASAYLRKPIDKETLLQAIAIAVAAGPSRG
jgi:FixJ family two-component response regulator